MCAVVQWKTRDVLGGEILRTQTYMFCSDDRKHDGVFAAHCLEYLAREVISLFCCSRYLDLFHRMYDQGNS